VSFINLHKINVDLTPIKKNSPSMNLEDIPSTQDFDRSGLLKHVLAQLKISRDGDQNIQTLCMARGRLTLRLRSMGSTST